jgi:hypothetical protein
MSLTKKVINLYSRDISKQFIDNIHKYVFGYSTIIDPLTYKGKIVKKNDIKGISKNQNVNKYLLINLLNNFF